MLIPASGRIFWPGTSISIPSGWSEDSAFADRFIQGSNSGYVTPINSGSTTHTHISSAHTHIGNAHSHTFSSYSTNVNSLFIYTANKPVTSNVSVKGDHSHSIATSFPATIVYDEATVTIEATDGKPEYINIVVIKPDDNNQSIPNSGIVYTNELTTLEGFSIADGSFGTTDIVDRFMLGTSIGGDGGSTGGSGTHSHVASGHTHIINSHSHAPKAAGPPQVQNAYNTFSIVGCMNTAHHDIFLSGVVLSDLTDESVTVNQASSEPAFVKLLGIQNTSGDDKLPSGAIIAFVDKFDNIPNTWTSVPETYDRQVKATSSSGQVGDIGGSNTHSHTAISHTHTHLSHGHIATQTDNIITTYYDGGSVNVVQSSDIHQHAWNVGTTVPTMQSSIVNMSGVDARYKYRDVLFIKFTGDVPSAIAVSTSGDLFAIGSRNIATSGDLFICGHIKQSSISSPSLFIESHTSSVASGDLVIAGHIKTTTSNDIFIRGLDNTQTSTNLFTEGHTLTLSSGNLFIEGQSLANTTSISGDLFILSHQDVSASLNIYTKGLESFNAPINLLITGIETVDTSRNLFIQSNDATQTSSNLFIRGNDFASVNVNLLIGGSQLSIISNNLFIEGNETAQASNVLFINGINSTSIINDLFIYGIDSNNDTRNLYINGSELTTLSGNLFIEGKTEANIASTSRNLFTLGVENISKSINLHIEGQESLSDTVNLLIVGSKTVSIYSDLFIGSLDGIQVSGNLLIRGIDTSIVVSDLFLEGSQLSFVSGDLFILGPQPPVNSLDLFIYSTGIVHENGIINCFINGVNPKPIFACPILDSNLSIHIPDSLIKMYQSRLDALVNQLGKNVLLEFDPIREPCPNCTFDIMRNRSTGVYKIGGPRPFMRGRKCPWCKGHGLLETPVNKCIQCLVEWSLEDDEDFDISINSNPGVVRIKTYLSITDDLIKARTIVVNHDITNSIKLRAKLIRGPFPIGLREDRYSISFWELI